MPFIINQSIQLRILSKKGFFMLKIRVFNLKIVDFINVKYLNIRLYQIIFSVSK